MSTGIFLFLFTWWLMGLAIILPLFADLEDVQFDKSFILIRHIILFFLFLPSSLTMCFVYLFFYIYIILTEEIQSSSFVVKILNTKVSDVCKNLKK